MVEKVDMMRKANHCVPLTHQSLAADIELAKGMQTSKKEIAGGVILGGHEHVKIHEHVSDDVGQDNTVQIVKTGMNSDRAAVIDLHFNSSTLTLQNTEVTFEELDERYQPCPVVNSISKQWCFQATLLIQLREKSYHYLQSLLDLNKLQWEHYCVLQ